MIAAFLIAALMTQPVTVEIHYMAPGVKSWIHPPANTWGKGFTLEEYKVLLQMDDDLFVARQQLRLGNDLELKWNQLLEEKDEIIRTLKDDVAIEAGRADRVQWKWDKCEDDLTDDLTEASGGDYLPWIIAAVGAGIGIAGAGVAIGVLLDK